MAGLQQQLVARALPRLVRPLAERVRYAAAWYADGVRVSDIAAAAVLAHSQVTIAAVALGHELRTAQGVWLSLVDILDMARRASDQSVQGQFGLSAVSLLGVRALLLDGRPRQPRQPPPPPPTRLMKRCPACKRVEPTDSDKSPCCGVLYG